jgi:hypothetical protein
VRYPEGTIQLNREHDHFDNLPTLALPHHQTVLSSVGRLHFDRPDDYAHYSENVVAYETAMLLPSLSAAIPAPRVRIVDGLGVTALVNCSARSRSAAVVGCRSSQKRYWFWT